MQYACNNCGFGKPLFYQAHGKLKPSETKMTKGIHEGPETPQNCPVCHSTDLDLCLEGHDHKCRRGTVMGRCGRCGVDEPCFSSTAKSEPQEEKDMTTAYMLGVKEERERVLGLPCMQDEEESDGLQDFQAPKLRNSLRREIRDALQSK